MSFNLMEIRDAIDPVAHWYCSDEQPRRPLADVIKDIVDDLQSDREAALLLAKIVLAARSVDGDEAHRMLPAIWPLICEADKLPGMPPRNLTKEGK